MSTCFPSITLLLLSLFFFFQSSVSTALDVTNAAFGLAMDRVFVLDSASSPVSAQESCLLNIRDLLIRQRMPTNISDVRNMKDSELYDLLIRASITGISPWKRDDNNKIKLTDFGYPIHPSLPTNIESDVMTCIICALLIVIATFHLINIFSMSD